MSKKWTVYRVNDIHADIGTPVRRGGEIMRFKNKRVAENWIEENQPTSTVKNTTFVVRRKGAK